MRYYKATANYCLMFRRNLHLGIREVADGPQPCVHSFIITVKGALV
jgi:hypothetical protein